MLRSRNIIQTERNNDSYNNAVNQINRMQLQMRKELNTLFNSQNEVVNNYNTIVSSLKDNIEYLEWLVGFLRLLVDNI